MIEYDINLIKTMLSHRYPFLLVDRVIEVSDDPCQLIALKNVTTNEPFFQGHFPEQPVMPGVLIIEALAQAAGLLTVNHLDMTTNDNELFYLAGVDKARFKHKVVPGDQLILKVGLIKARRGRFFKFSAEAFVEKKLVSSCEITAVRGQL